MNLDLFVQNLVKEITQTVSLSKFLPSIVPRKKIPAEKSHIHFFIYKSCCHINCPIER